MLERGEGGRCLLQIINAQQLWCVIDGQWVAGMLLGYMYHNVTRL